MLIVVWKIDFYFLMLNESLNVYMWFEICGIEVDNLRDWFYFFYFLDKCFVIYEFYKF